MRAAAVEIIRAESREQIEQARKLFLEYVEWLGFSLCFQGFDQELAELPWEYAPPSGRLLLACAAGGEPAGCVALHRLEAGVCEMKRLYVRPAYQGQGVGRALAEAVIGEARGIGYQRMRLDTVADKMQTAVAMYRALGFREIPPYRENPMAHTLYMELDLRKI
ncbi:MAG TPA: GNAT family N-acetyltransferase [Terriglobales bacterium]|jgi:GNAT superfamily N-acetyltransferase|nr:GNAT family N-acetyltransferase [Terriglobales bacterium]